MSRTSASHIAAPLDRGEIQIVVADGAFELPRAVPARNTIAACVSIRSTAEPACVDGDARKAMMAD